MQAMAENKYLSQQLSKAKNRFTEFQDVRRNYDILLERRAESTLPPELEELAEGINYQTPDIEKALGDYEDVLKMNPTFFDVLPWTPSPKNRETSRDILYWLARGWEYENEGRWWDRAVGEGQVRHGAKVMRLLTRPISDPETEASSPKEVLEVREKAQRHRKHPFFWEDCDVYNCYWIGDEQGEYGPDIFFYQYQMPYIEACQKFQRDDEKMSLNRLGKVAWVGAAEDAETNQWDEDTVTVTVVDCRDLKNRRCALAGCTHHQRIIRVYVNKDGGDILDDENIVSEQDSPFPNCSFYVIGGRISSKADPNLRFRPLMHALYVEAQIVNHTTDLLLTEIRADYGSSGLYLNYGESNPQILQLEDQAQDRQFEFNANEPGKVQGLPGKLERVPRNVSPHLPQLRADHMERMTRYLPNRFMQGEAYKEASNATGTAFISQMQQASLPFNTLLGESDRAIMKSRQAEIHAVMWWAMGQEEPDDWYAVMTGNSAGILVGGDTPRRGTVAKVNANKLDMDFDIVIRTKSATNAEKGAEWLQVKDQFNMGALAPDDLIRATGQDDIEGAYEKLEEAWQTSIMEPDAQVLIRQMVLRALHSLTNVDVTHLTGVPGQPPGGMDPSSSPSLPGGAPPGTSQNNPGSTVPPNSIMGRSIQGPPVGGVAGGSSPVG